MHYFHSLGPTSVQKIINLISRLEILGIILQMKKQYMVADLIKIMIRLSYILRKTVFNNPVILKSINFLNKVTSFNKKEIH